jgi:hypothetical protein
LRKARRVHPVGYGKEGQGDLILERYYPTIATSGFLSLLVEKGIAYPGALSQAATGA